MITNGIIGFFIAFLRLFFGWLPVWDIASLWYIGPTLSTVVDSIALTWNAFMVTFPYALTGWQVFIYVIIPFEALLLLAKLILGSRTPVSHIN